MNLKIKLDQKFRVTVLRLVGPDSVTVGNLVNDIDFTSPKTTLTNLRVTVWGDLCIQPIPKGILILSPQTTIICPSPPQPDFYSYVHPM